MAAEENGAPDNEDLFDCPVCRDSGLVEDPTTPGRLRVAPCPNPDCEARPERTGGVSIRVWADDDLVEAAVIADRWVLKRRQAVANLEQQREFYEARLREINEWWETIEAAATRPINFAEAMLEQYHAWAYAEQRTVKLPGATLERKPVSAKKTWSEADALAWQEDAFPDDVAVKRSLSKTAANKHLSQQDDGAFVDDETGEVVEFVRMEAPEVPFAFKVVDATEGAKK